MPRGDQRLVQIVDQALAEAARRSGAWLVCRRGCTQCCVGPFPINQLDVARLRTGMEKLQAKDPQKAEAVLERALQSVTRLSPGFPGDIKTGILSEDDGAVERFEDFANDEPCPALAADGACDLYESRPMTCRVFGPPIQSGDDGALGHCELCYHGATPEEVAACERDPGTDSVEEKLNLEVEKTSGRSGKTVVAFALAKS